MSDPSGDPPGAVAAGIPRTAAAGVTRRRARREGAAADSGSDFQSQVRAARNDFENQVAHARAEFDEANERIKQRTGRNLILAVLIGLTLGAVLIGSLIFVKWLFVGVRAGGRGARDSSSSAARSAPPAARSTSCRRSASARCLVLAGYFLDPWLHWVTDLRGGRRSSSCGA